jgi:hypothetical protein
MDSHNTIYELKNEMINKIQLFVDQYSRNEESNLQRIAEVDLKLRTNIDTIRDQENQISLLGKKNQDLEKANHDFSVLINELQEKILVLEEVKRQEDRFDIVRVQANDIHQKDLEIERLNKLLKKDKLPKSPKSQQQPIETLIQSVETKSIEIKAEEVVQEEDVSPKEVVQEDINPVKEDAEEDKPVKEDAEESDDEGEEVESIMYKKKEYYYIVGEKEKNVYEILEDDELGPVFGKWKEVKGKKRVVPN